MTLELIHKNLAEVAGLDIARVEKAVRIVSYVLPGAIIARLDHLLDHPVSLRSFCVQLCAITADSSDYDMLILAGVKAPLDLSIQGKFESLALTFLGCQVGGALNLTGLMVKRLEIRKTRCNAIEAGYLKTQNSVRIYRSTVDNGTNLVGARIGGDLSIAEARLWLQKGTVRRRGSRDASLYAPGAIIDGNLVLGPQLIARRHVVLDGVKVARKFIGTGLSLRPDDKDSLRKPVLRGHGLRVGEVAVLGPRRIVGERYDPFLLGRTRNKDDGNAATIIGRVDFAGATFSDDLIMSGATVKVEDRRFPAAYRPENIQRIYRGIEGKLEPSEAVAIDLTSARIGGRLKLDRGLSVIGEIRLNNAKIDRDVMMDGAAVFSLTRDAVNVGGADIGGSVFLGARTSREQTHVAGRLRFKHTSVEEDLYLGGLRVWPSEEGSGLDARHAKIGGVLTMPVEEPSKMSVPGRTFKRNITRFDAASVRQLAFFDERSWPRETKTSLDGFTYTVDDIDLDRLKTLRRVCVESHGADEAFSSQPLRHLAVLAGVAGYLREEKSLLIKRERLSRLSTRLVETTDKQIRARKRRAEYRQACRQVDRWAKDKAASPPSKRPPLWLIDWRKRAGLARKWFNHQSRRAIAGIDEGVRDAFSSSFSSTYRMTGYGYQPVNIFWILIALFSGTFALFMGLGGESLFIPNNVGLLKDPSFQTDGSLPPGYPALNIALYTADLLIPVIDLGQQSSWQVGPSKETELTDLQFDIGGGLVIVARLMGWGCASLLVASVTSLIKK